jgi:hypothetical protein
MRNIIEEYGRNAGKIWEALNVDVSLPQTKLIRKTRLKNDEFHGAVGWLARENKIKRETIRQGLTYRLGETNLLTKIGGDAGVVWNTLSSLGENDVFTIANSAKLEPNDVYAALGWLAREDKIDVTFGTNQQITFKLKNDGSIAQAKSTQNPPKKQRRTSKKSM